MQSALEIKSATNHQHSPLSYLWSNKTDKSIEDIEIIINVPEDTGVNDKIKTNPKGIDNSWTHLQNWIKQTQDNITSLIKSLSNFLSKVNFDYSSMQEFVKQPIVSFFNLIIYLNSVNEFFKQKSIEDFMIFIVYEEDPEFEDLNTIVLKIRLNLPFEHVMSYWEEFERALDFTSENLPHLMDFPVFFESYK